jgi:hypothetical protein
MFGGAGNRTGAGPDDRAPLVSRATRPVGSTLRTAYLLTVAIHNVSIGIGSLCRYSIALSTQNRYLPPYSTDVRAEVHALHKTGGTGD